MEKMWSGLALCAAHRSAPVPEWEHGVVSSILVIEDDRDIREVLRRYLERAGHGVLTASTGAEALRMVESGGIDLALLDLGLPDIDGTEVLSRCKEIGTPPVIVLTARGTVEDRIRGLGLGADDYVVKPFSPTEVVLRVAAVLGRSGTDRHGHLTSFNNGRLLLNQELHTVVCDGISVETTVTEWGILAALASFPGRPFSRFELVNRVRGYEFVGYERTIDSHIKNLRQKLGAAGPQAIETLVGVGYRLGWKRDA